MSFGCVISNNLKVIKGRRYLDIIMNTLGYINGQRQICIEGGNTCSINGDNCFIGKTEAISRFGWTELCHLWASCTWLVLYLQSAIFSFSFMASCMLLPFWEYPYLLNGKFQLNILFQLNHKACDWLDTPTNSQISTLLKLFLFILYILCILSSPTIVGFMDLICFVPTVFPAFNQCVSCTRHSIQYLFYEWMRLSICFSNTLISRLLFYYCIYPLV